MFVVTGLGATGIVGSVVTGLGETDVGGLVANLERFDRGSLVAVPPLTTNNCPLASVRRLPPNWRRKRS